MKLAIPRMKLSKSSQPRQDLSNAIVSAAVDILFSVVRCYGWAARHRLSCLLSSSVRQVWQRTAELRLLHCRAGCNASADTMPVSAFYV